MSQWNGALDHALSVSRATVSGLGSECRALLCVGEAQCGSGYLAYNDDVPANSNGEEAKSANQKN
jgi:hypothetical protein